MKNIFLLALLFAGRPLFAQPLQTLYYANGKKYMQGHWTVTKNYLFESVERLTIDAKRQREQGSWEEDDFMPDADEEMFADEKYRRQQKSDMMGVVFDGPLTFWYASGGKQLQMEYQKGIVQGPFKEYYPTGGVLQAGTLEKGMASGPWNYFYKNGKPFYTGTYKAYPPAELEQQWAGSRIKQREGILEPWNDRSFWEWSYKAENEPDALLAAPFAPFYDMLLIGTLKEGTFTFWQKSGEKWAEISFAEDLPTGTWKHWGEGRPAPLYTLEWRRNKVLFATDSTGRRQEGTAAAAEIKQAAATAEKQRLQKLNDDIANQWKPKPKSKNLYFSVQQMPKFKGDAQAWIAQNLRYPPAAKAAGTEGEVVVTFDVRDDGTLREPHIARAGNPELDAEALRLVAAMPPWEPGRQYGEAVMVRQRVTVVFKLP